jgi:hypothetical protein
MTDQARRRYGRDQKASVQQNPETVLSTLHLLPLRLLTTICGGSMQT